MILHDPTRVWQKLYVGSIDSAEAIAKSNPRAISTVLTVCHQNVRSRAHGVRYLHFPLPDGRLISTDHLREILCALWTSILRGKVLVHCIAGVSRSPVIVAAYMAATGYKQIEAALSDINRLRPIYPTASLLTTVKQALPRILPTLYAVSPDRSNSIV